jgi:hypothetical protein
MLVCTRWHATRHLQSFIYHSECFILLLLLLLLLLASNQSNAPSPGKACTSTGTTYPGRATQRLYPPSPLTQPLECRFAVQHPDLLHPGKQYTVHRHPQADSPTSRPGFPDRRSNLGRLGTTPKLLPPSADLSASEHTFRGMRGLMSLRSRLPARGGWECFDAGGVLVGCTDNGAV